MGEETEGQAERRSRGVGKLESQRARSLEETGERGRVKRVADMTAKERVIVRERRKTSARKWRLKN